MHARSTAFLVFVLLLGFAQTAQAALVANPPMVVFPPTKVGACSTVNVTITNAGPGGATINNAVFAGNNPNDFSFDWGIFQPPFLIGPGVNFSGSVKFCPMGMGARSAILRVTAGGGIQLDVPLFGNSDMLFASPASIDFGQVVVPANSKPQTVTFINPTNAVISITNIQIQGPNGNWFRLGGMQVPPVKVPATGSAGIDLLATPLGVGGGMANATFTTDDAMVPMITIPLKVTGIVAAVTANPAAGNFGPVVVGSEGLINFTVTNTGNTTVEIRDFRFIDPMVCACFIVRNMPIPGNLPSLRPGDSLKFSVSFAPKAEGMFSARIEIDTDAPSARNIQIPLTGQGVTSLLKADPTYVDFDGVAVGTSSEPVNVTISNAGGAEVTISTVTLSGAGAGQFHADTMGKFTLAGGQSKRIPVTCKPLSPGTFSASLVITPMGFPPLQVPLTCKAVQLPLAIEVSPGTAEFDPVLVGHDSAPQSIGIKVPEGAADLVIDRITSTDAQFRVDTSSTMMVLRAGESSSFRVVFRPADAGHAMATISVFGKGELMPLGTLQARGSGAVSPDIGSESACAISGRGAPGSALLLLIVVGGIAVVLRRRGRG